MQFNDPTGGQGIVQDTYFRVGLNAQTGAIAYPLQDLVRNANTALDKVAALIIGADGRWQFDDSNYTTLPIGTTALVANQQDYTFTVRYLDIIRIEMQDPNGNWIQLEAFDPQDLPKGQSVTTYYNVPGIPQKYDKLGESIVLYPAPNYSQPASLKAYFQRKMEYFTVADTTKEPGFRQNLHEYVPVCMALAYAKVKTLPQAKGLMDDEIRLGNDIKTAYAQRQKDEKPRFRNVIVPKI